jgi:ABC-type Fe3+ transport system permease subunit
VLQVPPAQLLQLSPPATACDAPPSPLLNAENSEIARDVFELSHCLHWMGSSALLIGLSVSNVVLQSAQKYSYRGIVFTSGQAKSCFYCTLGEQSRQALNTSLEMALSSALLSVGLGVYMIV